MVCATVIECLVNSADEIRYTLCSYKLVLFSFFKSPFSLLYSSIKNIIMFRLFINIFFEKANLSCSYFHVIL